MHTTNSFIIAGGGKLDLVIKNMGYGKVVRLAAGIALVPAMIWSIIGGSIGSTFGFGVPGLVGGFIAGWFLSFIGLLIPFIIIYGIINIVRGDVKEDTKEIIHYSAKEAKSINAQQYSSGKLSQIFKCPNCNLVLDSNLHCGKCNSDFKVEDERYNCPKCGKVLDDNLHCSGCNSDWKLEE